MYDAFLRDIETYFEPVRLLKRGARGTVTLCCVTGRRASATYSAGSPAVTMSTAVC